tara:strand:+ start:228 stop:662 length:435 start_codon:yes stop_codon:yes gene_type:complete
MANKMVTRAYIVTHDYGIDVFESALGAARFITELLIRYGGYYTSIEARTRSVQYYKIMDEIHKELKTEEGRRHVLYARKVKATRLAKAFRESDARIFINAQVAYTARSDNDNDHMSNLGISVEPVDYFKGKSYPDYSNRLRGER